MRAQFVVAVFSPGDDNYFYYIKMYHLIYDIINVPFFTKIILNEDFCFTSDATNGCD